MDLVPFGKWRGTQFSKVPPLELLWLAVHSPEKDIQEAACLEKKARGLHHYRVLLTYHALDRLSARYWRTYIRERLNQEGIVHFLHRYAEAAYSEKFKMKKHGHYRYKKIRFVINTQNGQPVLKTVY